MCVHTPKYCASSGLPLYGPVFFWLERNLSGMQDVYSHLVPTYQLSGYGLAPWHLKFWSFVIPICFTFCWCVFSNSGRWLIWHIQEWGREYVKQRFMTAFLLSFKWDFTCVFKFSFWHFDLEPQYGSQSPNILFARYTFYFFFILSVTCSESLTLYDSQNSEESCVTLQIIHGFGWSLMCLSAQQTLYLHLNNTGSGSV